MADDLFGHQGVVLCLAQHLWSKWCHRYFTIMIIKCCNQNGPLKHVRDLNYCGFNKEMGKIGNF